MLVLAFVFNLDSAVRLQRNVELAFTDLIVSTFNLVEQLVEQLKFRCKLAYGVKVI